MIAKAPLQIPKSAVFDRAWRVTHELSETGELILFDESASEVVMFNEMGASIWELIDGKRSVNDIVDFIVSVRERPEERPIIERDVIAFLGQLSERRSIRLLG